MAPLSDNMRSAGFMMLSMAGFSLNDALIKLVADDMALFQAIFIRGVMATGLIGMLAAQQGALRFRPGRRDVRLLSLRCFGEIGGTICFLTALFNMPIANATAILQSVPLAVTLGAALFLGERVGWRRYLAIVAGFMGVLIIVRPGTEGFDAYALWALAAIVFIVIRDLSTRRLTPDVPSLFVTVLTAAAITGAAGLLSLVTEWRPVAAGSVGVLAAGAVCLLIGYVFGVKCMRLGEIGFVQPFRYTLLIWSITLGILFFGEYPDVWMLVGSAVVVAMGLFTFYRERQLGLTAARH
jgi:drug/metabolite transporter (DMT)-like permease